MTVFPVMSANKSRNEYARLKELQEALYRYCLSLTKSSWDAEDLVQESWLKCLPVMLRARHENVEALLLRTAKNTWIDQMRRSQKYRMLSQQLQNENTDSPESLLDIEEVLYGLMIYLSPLQRTVFLMRDVFQYSTMETAERLHTTEGAIKAALHRARTALEDVKEMLGTGEISLPEDMEMKSYLEALAAAWHSEHLPLLLQLASQLPAEAANGISLLATRRLRLNQRKNDTPSSAVRQPMFRSAA